MLFSCTLEHDGVALFTATRSIHPQLDVLGSETTTGGGQLRLNVVFNKGLALSADALTVTSATCWAGFGKCFSLEEADISPCTPFLDNLILIMLPCACMPPREGEAGLFLLLLFWVLSDEQLEFCEHTAGSCSSVRLLLSNCSASSSRHLNKYFPLDSWVALSDPRLLFSFFAFFSSLFFSFFSLFLSFFSALATSLSFWSFRAPG